MTHTRRCMLGVFAHPDDETSCAGGMFSRYGHAGVEVYVAMATRGEQGMLGTHGQEMTREDLPRVREAELRTVLQMYGARPPIFVGYRDQDVSHANADELIAKIAAVMAATTPDVVSTCGPLGLSGHPDHVAVHRATIAAFHRYRHRTTGQPRLYYKALLSAAVQALGFTLTGPEVQPTVLIDITAQKALKVRALRTYTPQEDAQRLAGLVAQAPWAVEAFHQAYPPTSTRVLAPGFWEDPTMPHDPGRV
jgi:LmbE family N-acetylglucosaminyl deacetylase